VQKEKPGPFYYGWFILGMIFITMILIYGVRNSFPVFFSPILKEFGWSRGNVAIMLSLNIFIYGFMAPIAGVLASRINPRRLVLFGLGVLVLATVGCTWAEELWHFYFFFGFLVGLGNAFCGWPVIGPALVNWFHKKRGLVMGLGQMGGGLSFVYGIFIELIILKWGWRNAYLSLGILLAAVLFPLHLFFFYHRPEEKSLKAYGAEEEKLEEEEESRGTEPRPLPTRDWTLREILRSPQLWFLVLAYGLHMGIGVYLVLAHQIKFGEDMGFSSIFSVSIFGLFGISLFLGQLSGFLSDWIGREKAGTLCAVLALIALVALLSVRNNSQAWLLYVYSLCFGYGAGLINPTAFAACADIFPGKHFGTVMGLLLMGMGTGGALGPWLGGYLHDLTGSYTIAFILSAVCFALGCIFLWVAAPRKAVLRAIKK
jgi:sugar phosphate permease